MSTTLHSTVHVDFPATWRRSLVTRRTWRWRRERRCLGKPRRSWGCYGSSAGPNHGPLSILTCQNLGTCSLPPPTFLRQGIDLSIPGYPSFRMRGGLLLCYSFRSVNLFLLQLDGRLWPFYTEWPFGDFGVLGWGRKGVMLGCLHISGVGELNSSHNIFLLLALYIYKSNT